MSPHRLTTYRRYRLSDDVLILILYNLDPTSIWRACKAFKRIYVIVMEFQPLRYKFELAVAGMKDGPVAHSLGPAIGRLPLLLTYRKDWPRLYWTHEKKLQIATPAHVGVSGGFLYQVRTHGPQWALDLAELPSYRTGRYPSQTRHIRFLTSQIENVAIDPSQGLLVTSHVFSLNGQIGIRLHLRDLWSFGQHPRASALIYEVNTQSTHRVTNIAIVICGSKLMISMQFVGGIVRHLLLEWRALQARWLDHQDVHFLNENYLLVAKQAHGTTVLNLYNIASPLNVSIEREFELPEAWGDAVIGFCTNASPMHDLHGSSNALFYLDPLSRLLVLTVKPHGSHSDAPTQWLFINESFFRPTSRKDRLKMSWNQWGQFCLIRDIPSGSTSIKGPHVVGTRVVYLETKPGRHNKKGGAQLNIVDFPPYPDASCQSTRAWSFVGPRATLVPNEVSRDMPFGTIENFNVEDIRVTEDNIVVFMESQPGIRPVNILTFGAPTPHNPQL